MECYNSDSDVVHAAGIEHSGARLDFPVCLLRWKLYSARAVKDFWVQRTSSVHFARATAGLRILTDHAGQGFFRALDVNAILAQFTSFLVLMAVPKKIMRFVMLYFLGNMSAIYRRSLVRVFDIKAQCGFAALQMMQNAAYFQKLSNVQTGGGISARVITKPTLHRCLSLALQTSEHLYEQEIFQISQFCFDAICSPPDTASSPMTAFLDLIPNSRPKRHLDQDAIYEDAYHQCCLMNDILGFDEVAQLFDKDRTRHSCETFFMPRDFRTCLEQARRLTVGSEEYTHVVSSLASSAKTQSLENLADIMLGGEDSYKSSAWAEEIFNWQADCKLELESLTHALQSVSEGIASLQQRVQ